MTEKSLRVFCCYAREDQSFLLQLKKHLTPLQRENLICIYDDIDINPGEDWKQKIKHYLKTAHIILLLISPDFLASEYCYSNEMMYAMERYEQGEASVVPIILRHCDWEEAPFSKLQALPTGAKTIISLEWHTQDQAFTDVVQGIRQLVIAIVSKQTVQNEYIDTSLKFETTSRTSSHLIYRAHNRKVTAVAWSPNGSYIASAGEDKIVQVCNTFNGKTILTYRGHIKPSLRNWIPKEINALAWSPDSSYLASASTDKTIQVWKTATGCKVLTYSNGDAMFKVAWSPDGKYLASRSGHWTYRTVRDDEMELLTNLEVWEAHTGRKVCRCDGSAWGKTCSVAWSPDSKYLASSYWEGSIRVWDAVTGREMLTCRGSSAQSEDDIFALAWSPDGTCIAYVDLTKIRVREFATGNVTIVCSGHRDVVRDVAWSPDSKYLASASKDRTIRVWKASTGQEILICDGHTSPVNAVAWSPDGTHLVSGSEDSTVQVWRIPF